MKHITCDLINTIYSVLTSKSSSLSAKQRKLMGELHLQLFISKIAIMNIAGLLGLECEEYRALNSDGDIATVAVTNPSLFMTSLAQMLGL